MSGRLVTIVIINWNYDRFLRQAVDSALGQTYAPIEVIVVDDGSTDGSMSILSTYGDRIKVVSKAHEGHVSALNAGVAASAGDVLFFLDADDLLYPTCVESVMRVWKQGLAKVQFMLDTIDANGVDQRLPFPYYPPDLDADEIRRRSLTFGYYPWPVSSGNAFARDLVARVTPVPGERIFKSPDGFLNKMAPLYGEVASLRRVLGAYRVHGRNAWAQSGSELNIQGYSRTVRFDQVLHGEFVKVASGFGHTVRPYEQQTVPQWLENRLISLRFRPEDHPIAGDSRWRLLVLGIRSALDEPGATVFGRIAWMGWFALLATLPRSIIGYLVKKARSQSGRSGVAQWLIAVAYGRSRPDDCDAF